jgi:tyrosyl-tRNA synthetase
MQDIFSELSWRGLIHQATDADKLPGWLKEKSRAVYAGFDPTADSLHVGHLMAIMVLRRFQKAGHTPLALVGGATGMIGDPSGKSEERNLLSKDSLQANVNALELQLRRFLDFDSATNGAKLLNNFDWMSRFSYLDFLRDIGKHFPVNVMLAKDSVKGRLERDSGISYTEFSYMLLQAYDFAYLNEAFGCELQVGGSDQWGNITAGIDLARRMRGAQLYGITCPLLTKADGTKMGKTEKGAVWLSASKTSPYAFYQYWINTADVDAGICLRYLTELPQDEVNALDTSRTTEPHLRQSQKRLAETLTELVHGNEGLAAARKATEIFFGAEIANLHDAQLLDIFADVPSCNIPRSRLEQGEISLIDAYFETGLAKTKSDGRRFIEQKGAYVNNQQRLDVKTLLTPADLASETVIVIRQGKKNYALLRVSE